MPVFSNVVDKKTLRGAQSEALKIIKDSLICSFGPMGSNTAMMKDGSLPIYSKDGHTILKNIIFNTPIEFSVKEDLTELTRHIVKTVGDGTTSAIILSAIIFEEMIKLENNRSPFLLIETFKKCVSDIIKEIKTHKKDVTIEDIYKIAMISTNGNEEVSSNLKDIYEKFGLGVFIDVNISNTTDNLIKIYDGMTLETGYSDSCFINTKATGTASIRNANIYIFEDPIDTPEMATFLDSIVCQNIIEPANKGTQFTPTVILAPKVSKDMASYMEKLTQFMSKIEDLSSKPPFLLVTNIYDIDQFLDIAKLCGAKTIKKYIDPKIQQMDIDSGNAPTPETVTTFGGYAELVEANINKTKFVNPKLMKNEDGSYTNIFNGLVSFLEAELDNAYQNGEDATKVSGLKRRLNSLKGNMVEYLVGGVSVSDRDSLRDLVEDAVLNCRSAAKNGYGYGANYEGLRAAHIIAEKDNCELEAKIFNILAEAYDSLATILYDTYFTDALRSAAVVEESLTSDYGCPFNLRTLKFDGDVLSSIDSDIVILETISKIVTLMFTCNQFICQSPMHNTYINPK